jgi:hypothetical protein
MPVKLNTSAVDSSAYQVTFNFTDLDGAPVVPAAVTWTMTDHTGIVINGRLNVVAGAAAEVNIILSGDDLRYMDGFRRVVTVHATIGGIPVRESAEFSIEDLVAV